MCGRDWSSDVCSSDLVAMSKCAAECKFVKMLLDEIKGSSNTKMIIHEDKIGRASCRERV